MVDDVLLERVTHFVNIVHMYSLVVGIHFATTLVYRHEHWLYAACGLCHQRGCTGRSYCQAGNVAAPVFHHVLVELCVGLLYAVDERIVLFAICIEYFKRATLLCHDHRRTISVQGECLVYIYRKVCCLLRTIAETHGRNHVAFGSDANASASSHSALFLYFLPKMQLCALNFIRLWVAANLFHYQLYLLKLQVDDVVHDTLGGCDMLLKQVVIEVCVLGERIYNVRIEVDGKQTARVVRTEWNLSARIGRHSAEAKVGITVRNALLQDGIPEQHTRLCAFPSVVDNLLPKFAGRYFLVPIRVITVDRECLVIRAAFDGGLHELIVYFHRHISSSDLTLSHLGVDESLGIGMLDADGEHQGTTSSVLCHLSGRVAVSLHKRHESCGSKG